MIDSLLDPVIIKTSIGSGTVFIVWFTLWYQTGIARTEREVAHICTLLSSSVTSLSSLPMVYTLFTHGLSSVLTYRTWTVQITVFFMTFLFFDLAIGTLFYPKKIGLLTGWIHHTVYLAVLAWAIRRQFCSVFIMMCLLEIPTFLLAIGSIRKYLRHDYLFATAFVVTRILFHLYTIVCATQLDRTIAIALFLFFPVHCYWFYGFIKQQRRLSAKPTKESPKTQQKKESTVQKKTSDSCIDDLNVLLRHHRKERNILSFHSPPVSVH